MIKLILGLIFGYAITNILIDKKVHQQSKLIERLNKDLILEKHKNNCYHKILREEKEKYLELLKKKPKEENNDTTR
jgi:hypothetical protein